MSTNTMKSTAIRVLAILALVAIPAFASPIYVNNFSFEDSLPSTTAGVNCGLGCTVWAGAIPGWTGGDGRFQPGSPANPHYFTTAPTNGATLAFSQGGTISQVVAPTVQAGLLYTLQVDIGWRADPGQGFDGSADLLIGGVSCGASCLAVGVTPTKGNWSTFTATYIGTVADVGKTITLELQSSGPQGDFDNVRLDAVPEPASLLLIGSALLGLGALRRRRANS